jgi:hypothetical protein
MSAESDDQSGPGEAVSADTPHMAWWRRRLFEVLLRLDATASILHGVPADRIHTADIPRRHEPPRDGTESR